MKLKEEGILHSSRPRPMLVARSIILVPLLLPFLCVSKVLSRGRRLTVRNLAVTIKSFAIIKSFGVQTGSTGGV